MRPRAPAAAPPTLAPDHLRAGAVDPGRSPLSQPLFASAERGVAAGAPTDPAPGAAPCPSMKLYYSPGACSLSPHIVAREAGLPVQIVLVARDKHLPDGSDYRAKNPKGYVPALELDDGELLTEGTAIVQYLADQAPDAGLAPPAGTLARYRLIEWLNYVATELHKGFSPLFNPANPPEVKAAQKERIALRLELPARRLAETPFLLGDRFSAADAYLYTILRWAPSQGIDLHRWPSLAAFVDRVSSRPAVIAALDAEKLKR